MKDHGALIGDLPARAGEDGRVRLSASSVPSPSDPVETADPADSTIRPGLGVAEARWGKRGESGACGSDLLSEM